MELEVGWLLDRAQGCRKKIGLCSCAQAGALQWQGSRIEAVVIPELERVVESQMLARNQTCQAGRRQLCEKESCSSKSC